MFEIKYIIKTLAPVTFAEKSGDSVLYATKRYIPGNALRGALANKYIRHNKLKAAHENEVFFDLFLSGRVKFLPAYPKVNTDLISMAAPLSLMSSKDGKTVKDFAGDVKLEAGYKKINGFIAVDKECKNIYSAAADVQIEFHMSRNSDSERIFGSSDEGNVFNYEYLEPYQEFIGSIIVEEDGREYVESIKELLADDKLCLGRSRNTQYGSSRITVLEVTELDDKKYIYDNNEKYFLYAYSSYIPKGSWQRVGTAAEELFEELVQKMHNAGFNVKLEQNIEKSFAAVETVDGYVGTWNMKRERKNAVAAGSLLCFKADGFSDDAWAYLNKLLFSGVGSRRAEGFGQFRLWKPLPDNINYSSRVKVPLQVLLPKAVRETAKKIMQQRILQEVRKLANDDAARLKNTDKARGTLRRIESLMNSERTMQEIKMKINDFKKPAIKNLRIVALNNIKLNEYLIDAEKSDIGMPYHNIDWSAKMEISSDMKNKLQMDLGKDLFEMEEEILFKEYWLWLTRFACKRQDKKVFNTGLLDSFKKQ